MNVREKFVRCVSPPRPPRGGGLVFPPRPPRGGGIGGIACLLACFLGGVVALVSDGCSGPPPRQSRRVAREEAPAVAGESGSEGPVMPPDLTDRNAGEPEGARGEQPVADESAPAKKMVKGAPKAATPKEEPSADEASAEGPAEPVQEAPRASRPVPKRGKMTPEEMIRMMGLDSASKKKEAEELVKQARADKSNLDLEHAEERLEEAHRLDPQNKEAERLLAEVRTIRGDKRGLTKQVYDNLLDQKKVEIEQARAEVRGAINSGDRRFDTKEFDSAIRDYEKAIDLIRTFHYNLQLDGELGEAQKRLASAKAAQKSQAEEDRLALEAKVRDNKETENRNSLNYRKNRLEELHRKAQEAWEMKDYEKTEILASQILQETPNDEAARVLESEARDQRHISSSNKIMVANMENHARALLSLEESSIPYQKIFMYPPGKEWKRLQPKTITLEERVGAEESVVEKEIKRKLDEAQTIEFPAGTAFEDARKTLASISGVNFILNKEAGEAVKSGDIKVDLPPMKNMPLKSILFHLLAAAGEKNFTFAIEYGAVVIGTKDTMKPKFYVQFYDIKDVTQPHPDFSAPPIALDDLQGSKATNQGISVGDETAENRGSGEIETTKLIELVSKEMKVGDETVGVEPKVMNGKLMVKTTLEIHQKVLALLTQLRKATGIMVTVESRFLDIQDNFLEEIGVDMGNGNNTFLPNSIPDIDGSGTSVAPGYEFTNSEGDFDFRSATISSFSNQLGSKVNPFNISSSGGGAYQLNIFDAEKFQLEAILTGVGKRNEIRKLNSPRVTAFNTQVSHTLVINQAAYIQDLEVNQTGVIPVINPVIGVLNSGSILEVRPTVSYDRKYVVLEIQPTLAEKLESEFAILNLSGSFTVVPVELPVLSVTKIKTTVTVPDGGTVLVGGLRREIKTEESIGIPVLRRIPILGLLFGRRGEANLRSNLFVLINCKITVVQEEEERLFNT